jgi:vWA-MoxR associated protein middle region (VMAP-M) 2
VTAVRRHLLVVASQCRAMDHLRRLEQAARELHEALTDPALGACIPGLADGRSYFYDELSSAEIGATVQAAIRFAGEQGATLVLALLGHGFTPGDTATLYLMGTDAEEGERTKAVEVGPLLRDAADQLGVNGVIGIVDTCHAAASQPSAQELSIGSRAGRTRLSLVMASSAAGSAYDLQLSRKLAMLVRQGLDDAGPFLHVAKVVEELRLQITNQAIVRSDYDGDSSADADLWLAFNARQDVRSLNNVLGPAGQAELGSALRNLGRGHSALQEPWDADTLRRLRRELADGDNSPRVERARRAVGDAIAALETVKFLRSQLIHKLNTRRLRRALTALRASQGQLSPIPQYLTDVEAVDHVAFNYPAANRDCRTQMARFVILLAREAGISADDATLRRWADSVDGQIQLNDAAEADLTRQADQQLRLVVSLHASLAGDWPESLEAWLLQGGELRQHDSFRCITAGQPEAENALGDALAWAHQAAEALDLRLRRVDVAAPAALLLDWRPEEVIVGGEFLGVSHDVLVHWSQRLSPPRTMWWIRKAASDRLREIGSCASGAPLDWLSEEHTRELDALRERLQKGQYMRGVGLQHHPGADIQLMDLLFSYIPIVLWPQTEAGFPAFRHSSLDQYWEHLPAAFLTAYRRRWSGGDPQDLADLRAVWDDYDWLDFCKKVAGPPLSESGSRS